MISSAVFKRPNFFKYFLKKRVNIINIYSIINIKRSIF